TSNPFFVIPAVVVFVMAVGAAFWLWLRSRRANKTAPAGGGAPAPASGGPDPIQGMFREAEERLKLSPRMNGVALSSLPAFLLIGPEKSGKTNLVLHSGLDPELLAGQVYQGSEVVPSKTVNIWLGRGTLWVEVPAFMASDGKTLANIVKRLSPRGLSGAFGKQHPPRGIILCLKKDILIDPQTPDELTAAARPWNQCLINVAAALGVQLPVYTVFTNLDTLAGFPEFVANLSQKDCAQSIGATVRPFNPAGPGVYAEETARLINEHFAQISYSLCDSRVPLLPREQDRLRAAQQYQFPREFQKLQKQLVQFVVDVAKPSQLQVAPFLRGFYFTGTRRTMAEASQMADPALAEDESQASDSLHATTLLSAEQVRRQLAAAKAAMGGPQSREITQWLFAEPLFQQVLLQDRAAQSISAASTRTDRVRALIFAIGLFAALVLFFGMTWSYVRNRSLERALVTAAHGLAPNTQGDILQRLDVMRQPLDRLMEYRESTPLGMRWGLYHGDALVAPAQTAYCTAMRSQVLESVARKMTDQLAQIRSKTGDHSGDFALLKAYMMMTTHPEKGDGSFLSQELGDYWRTAAGPRATPAAEQLAAAQFRTYGNLLPVRDAQSACVFQAPQGVIPAAQDYIRSLNLNDRYRTLLDQAGRGVEPVDYNKRFPNDAVSDAKVVPGWFTRQGWAKMQDLLAHPEQSLKADAWVLGESKDLTPEELSTLAATFRTRYVGEYAQAWRDYLAAASVKTYASLEDAAAKLEKMSGPRSILLNLIALASEHTGAIEAMKPVFQPAKSAVPAVDDFQPSAEYLKQLDQLKNRLSKAAGSNGPAHDQDAQDVRNAALAAKDSVDGIARSATFKGETDQVVKAILLKPITQIDPLLNKQNDEAINGVAKDLCNTFGRLARQLPFAPRAQQSASQADVQRILAPETGEMWTFYKNYLADSLDCQDTGCTLKSRPRYKLSPGFVHFFSALNNWSHLLFGAGRGPGGVRLLGRAIRFNNLKQLEISIDGQKVTLSPDRQDMQPINWDPTRSQALQILGTFEGDPQPQRLILASGPWAIFEWLFDTEPGEGLTWLPRSGATMAMKLANGNNMKYKLEIRWGDGSNRPLDMRSLLVGTTCPAAVTK
ncbi:MAG: ImcF domain protein, partial [Candidatus Solibacter sp.]|nr:ImcF domain protein [Candidatus Solibacter sp.]